MNICGIDVDSKELKLVVRKQGKNGSLQTFSNNALEHVKLIKMLLRNNVQRVCLEATGVYHFDLAVALSEVAGLELMVLNPKVARRFAEALSERQKTDKVDAQVLAQYAERMPFVPWQPPSKPVLALRAISRRLHALVAQRTQAKNQLHAAKATKHTPAIVADDIALTVEQLQQQIDRLQAAAMALIGEDEQLSNVFALITSIKGFAEVSTVQIMGELMVLPQDMNARQWVAMAGLDPRHHQSGTTQKPTRISKAGNRHLRQALYMPALCASRHEPHVAGFKNHLVNRRGLKKIQAVVAVMRKLLHAIHGMLRTQTAFDGARFRELSAAGSDK
jgi:transposase